MKNRYAVYLLGRAYRMATTMEPHHRVMKILTIIFYLILCTMLLALAGLPLALIIVYPSEGEHFTKFAEVMIPWGVVLLLSAIFSDQIRNVMDKLVDAIDRAKSFSAGGAVVEFNQSAGATTTPEQIAAMGAHVQLLSTQNQEATNLASHFFLKYVSSTIFGSQFRFIKALQDGQLTRAQAVMFYNQFIANVPKNTNYPFELWVGYLVDNYMVSFEANTGHYQVTPAGRNFMNQAAAANINDSTYAR